MGPLRVLGDELWNTVRARLGGVVAGVAQSTLPLARSDEEHVSYELLATPFVPSEITADRPKYGASGGAASLACCLPRRTRGPEVTRAVKFRISHFNS